MTTPTDDNGSQWHLNKSINIGHLLTTLVIAGAFYNWSVTLEVRQAQLNARVDTVERVQTLQNDAVIRELNHIKSSFESVNKKMDTLLQTTAASAANGVR